MKNYIASGGEESPDWGIRTPITVIGECFEPINSLFAKVQLTASRSNSFELEDSVVDKQELKQLNVGWPEPFVLGLLEVLEKTKPQPLRNVRIVLEEVWYHDVDSCSEALVKAGRDAGRKILAQANNK
jgi:hypothetical protein